MQFADNHRDNLARQCVIEEFRVDGLPHDGEELEEEIRLIKKSIIDIRGKAQGRNFPAGANRWPTE